MRNGAHVYDLLLLMRSATFPRTLTIWFQKYHSYALLHRCSLQNNFSAGGSAAAEIKVKCVHDFKSCICMYECMYCSSTPSLLKCFLHCSPLQFPQLSWFIIFLINLDADFHLSPNGLSSYVIARASRDLPSWFQSSDCLLWDPLASQKWLSDTVRNSPGLFCYKSE